MEPQHQGPADELHDGNREEFRVPTRGVVDALLLRVSVEREAPNPPCQMCRMKLYINNTIDVQTSNSMNSR